MFSFLCFDCVCFLILDSCVCLVVFSGFYADLCGGVVFGVLLPVAMLRGDCWLVCLVGFLVLFGFEFCLVVAICVVACVRVWVLVADSLWFSVVVLCGGGFGCLVWFV